MNRPADTITITLPEYASFSDALPLVQDGVRYVAVTANRIDSDLAARRRALRESGKIMWSEECCVPGLHVTYHRATSPLVSSLGLGR